MEKEFIPYEQALALKELEFDEPCILLYRGSDTQPVCQMGYVFKTERNSDVYDETNYWLTVPTFSQCFRWFREKYDLDYSLLPESSSGYRLLDRTFNIVIYKYYMNMNVQSEIVRIDGKIARYNKREEAELECLKKLIEIVKEKKNETE